MKMAMAIAAPILSQGRAAESLPASYDLAEEVTGRRRRADPGGLRQRIEDRRRDIRDAALVGASGLADVAAGPGRLEDLGEAGEVGRDVRPVDGQAVPGGDRHG